MQIKKFGLMSLLLMVVMSMAALSSCGNDDEPSSNDITKIVVGVWSQDGDNDILELKSNGTGNWYENPEDYAAKEIAASFDWKFENGVLVFSEDGDAYEFLKCQSSSNDKIVWQRFESSNLAGEYEIWTWARYK